jgi:small subunit ribosomal protein S20
MPNHKSALKRVRSSARRRLENKYKHKTCKSLLKALKKNTNKDTTPKELSKVFSALDKLAKKNIIHKNKSSNLKSKLAISCNKI